MTAVEMVFQHDHPASRGHFPGDPIIPGAVVLNEILQAMAASLGCGLPPLRIRSAKFLSPARPGDRMVIRFSRTGGGEIRFTGEVEGRSVLVGQVACSVPAAAK